LVKRKHFPAAIVDVDFAGTGGGLSFVRFVQEKSKPTRVVLLTGRRSFEEAVEAFRLGVVDVVSKRPDQLPYLQGAVRRAMDLALAGEPGGALLFEVKDVLEDALRIMFTMGRRLYGGTSETSAAGLAIKPAILVIDEDQAFLKQVAAALGDKPWDVSVELTGGAGLDRASTFNFQIVAVRDQLHDLPGHMLLRSAQAQQTSLGLLYSVAGAKAERYEAGRATKSWPFSGPAELVRCLEELVVELSARREERRYMQAFRTEHGAFLKRFAELKSRIDSLTG
jgi:ActR/RegA family two-component response regulator